MALSNKRHALLTTDNKSELAVGYCTLCGDVSGLGVIADVPKTMVYRVRWLITRGHAVIPDDIHESTVSRRRPNQTDQIRCRHATSSTRSCSVTSKACSRPTRSCRPDSIDRQSTACWPWSAAPSQAQAGCARTESYRSRVRHRVADAHSEKGVRAQSGDGVRGDSRKG